MKRDEKKKRREDLWGKTRKTKLMIGSKDVNRRSLEKLRVANRRMKSWKSDEIEREYRETGGNEPAN